MKISNWGLNFNPFLRSFFQLFIHSTNLYWVPFLWQGLKIELCAEQVRSLPSWAHSPVLEAARWTGSCQSCENPWRCWDGGLRAHGSPDPAMAVREAFCDRHGAGMFLITSRWGRYCFHLQARKLRLPGGKQLACHSHQGWSGIKFTLLAP
jgi:hypothetical protein